MLDLLSYFFCKGFLEPSRLDLLAPLSILVSGSSIWKGLSPACGREFPGPVADFLQQQSQVNTSMIIT